MNTADRWTFEPDRLSEALEPWNAIGPSDEERSLVNDLLMDLVIDPIRRGVEDE